MGIGLLLGIFTTALHAQALPTQSLVPGGIAVVRIGANTPANNQANNPEKTPKVEFNNKPAVVVSYLEDWYAVIALPLNLKLGLHHATIKKDKETQRLPFKVGDKKYEEQHLTIKNKGQVNLSKANLKRYQNERKIITQLYTTYTNQSPDFNFKKPTQGPFSSLFGLKRFLNDQPRAPHKGLDIAAPEGTPIYATSKGEVIYAGDFFFNGNSVFIHHGQGVISFYSHLQNTLVKQGDQVTHDTIIGTVGKTGRVTGAHLHWSIYFSGVPVDPMLFIAGE